MKPDISRIVKELDKYDPPEEELDDLLNLGKYTLKEIQGLIQFEDSKAGRILTAMAFLSGMFGAMYATMLRTLGPGVLSVKNWSASLWAFNVIFGVYLLLIVAGALLIVFAVRSKYVFPDPEDSWAKIYKESDEDEGFEDPKSFIFFEKIISVSPRDWARAWTSRTAVDLKRKYLKNLILECYIVSNTLRNKHRFLQPGVYLLCLGTVMFILWLISAMFLFIAMPADNPYDNTTPGVVSYGMRGDAGFIAGSCPEPSRPVQEFVKNRRNRHPVNMAEQFNDMTRPSCLSSCSGYYGNIFT